jgi:hypothetical protein
VINVITIGLNFDDKRRSRKLDFKKNENFRKKEKRKISEEEKKNNGVGGGVPPHATDLWSIRQTAPPHVSPILNTTRQTSKPTG